MQTPGYLVKLHGCYRIKYILVSSHTVGLGLYIHVLAPLQCMIALKKEKQEETEERKERVTDTGGKTETASLLCITSS